MSENNISKTTLFYIKELAYILFSNFLINVKTKINCKTESYFLIMLIINAGGHAGGPHLVS